MGIRPPELRFRGFFTFRVHMVDEGPDEEVESEAHHVDCMAEHSNLKSEAAATPLDGYGPNIEPCCLHKAGCRSLERIGELSRRGSP